MSPASRACLLMLLALPACGGDPFVAGELAVDDGGATDSAAIADSAQLEAGDGASAPLPDAGAREASAPPPDRDAGASIGDAHDAAVLADASSSSDGGTAAFDGGGPPDADAGTLPDAGPPPDPVTYACGTQSTDGTTPVASSLQWWASVSVQKAGGYTEDYCASMSTGTSATFPYTCEGIASVWDCAHWQAAGGTLGCHPSTVDPGVLQVDCWIP